MDIKKQFTNLFKTAISPNIGGKTRRLRTNLLVMGKPLLYISTMGLILSGMLVFKLRVPMMHLKAQIRAENKVYEETDCLARHFCKEFCQNCFFQKKNLDSGSSVTTQLRFLPRSWDSSPDLGISVFDMESWDMKVADFFVRLCYTAKKTLKIIPVEYAKNINLPLSFNLWGSEKMFIVL